jgi:carbamoyltransferase
MNILGLHFDHDGSAAIVSDGKILCAISSERITKIKKMKGITSQVINYVLQESNMTIDDIDAISLSDYNIENSHGTLKLFDNETQVNVIRHVVHDQQYLELTGVLMNKTLPVYVIPHHTSHAAAAYYTSNFKKSWCFSMDSSNNISQANSLIMYGDGNQLIAQDYLGMMIGVGYELFTDFTGIGNPIFKAGSTMGLASYGKISKKIIDNIEKYIQESYFPINTTEDVFFKYYENLWKYISGKLYKTPKHQSYSYESMELAATIQYLFEKCILDVINNKIPKNEINNLCLSGGSFLNCNVNSKIKQDSRFKNIHLFPACGDDGIPIGSALFVTHHIFNIPRKNHEVNEICYLGKNYEYTEPNYELIAKLISEGKIIAWFMGKSEYGQGFRSKKYSF